MCENRKMESKKVSLRRLRGILGVGLCELARTMDVSHAAVSRIESWTPRDSLVRTLDSYLGGLGLELEVWVLMPDGSRVRLEVDKAS